MAGPVSVFKGNDMSVVPGKEMLAFARYYLCLRWRVAWGQHYTHHSLGLKYRWRYWQRNARLNPYADK